MGRHLVVLLVVLGSLIVTRRTEAGRSLLLPPYRLAAYHDFHKSVWGTAISLPEGEDLLVGITLIIDLANLSSTAQTGTLEFQETVTNYLGLANASECCPGRRMSIALSLCTNIDGDFQQQSVAVAGPSASTGGSVNWPRAVNWSLPANGSTNFRVAAYFTGKYSDTNVTRFDAIYAMFTPALKIVVTDDRGAISGSMAAQYVSSSTQVTCGIGGTTLTGRYGAYLNDPGTTAPIPLNGGRAF